jgi:protocatechuate 3,4-dioxygenase beta subunit
MFGALVLAASTLVQAAPQAPPPRDAVVARPGAGVIKGRVIAADTGQPLYRAVVSLSTAGAPPRNIPAKTDGTFEFSNLPAGSYRLRVMPGNSRGHYLPIAFGARSPLDVGKAIELADGQIVEAAIALQRGGTIAGRVVDDFGEPVSGVVVYPFRVTAAGSFLRLGLPGRTDDLGRFRLFGLMPDEYVVAAEPHQEGAPDPGAEGFAITYFPSAFSEREASRVRVAAGREAGDVQISLIRTRTFRITGTVLDSQGRPIRSPNMLMARVTKDEQTFYSGSFESDGEGNFSTRNVPPGNYRILVRPSTVHLEGASGPKHFLEHASVAVTVAGNVDGLAVVTQPATTISGQIVIADGAPRLPALSVRAQPPNNTLWMASAPTAPVNADLAFTLKELFGPYYIRLTNLPSGYVMKAVMLGDADITDTLTEFKPEHSGRLKVVLTGRTSILEGTVADERGQPASEVSVITLPEDRTSWRFGSFRLRITTATDGKFRLEGLLPGRYQVVAIGRDRLRPSLDVGAEILERFLGDAVAVVLEPSDKKTVALRVARGPEQP